MQNYGKDSFSGFKDTHLTPKQAVFTALFLVIAIGGSFALAGGNPGRTILFLFLLFPILGVVAKFARAMRPSKGRILLLRKFHTERPPNFPVSQLLSTIDAYGYEVVTLSDSLVRKSPDRIFVTLLCGVIALCVHIIYSIVSATFGSRRLSPWWHDAINALEFTSVEAFLLKHAPGGWKDWSTLDATQLERAAQKPIRGVFDLGLVVVRCSDDNWHCVVEKLALSSVVVCIDISNPSDHIRTEVALVGQHAAQRVIWLRQENAPSPFLNGPLGGYSIFRHRFSGARFEFPYPADPSGELHAASHSSRVAIARHGERLLKFIQARTTSA